MTRSSPEHTSQSRSRLRTRMTIAGAACTLVATVALCAGIAAWPGAFRAQAQPAKSASKGSPEIRDAPAPDYGPPPVASPAPRVATSMGSSDASQESGPKLDWATLYMTWFQVTGYVLGTGHGVRLEEVRVSPYAAAQAHLHNSELVRDKLVEGFRSYPVGTLIAMQTWDVAPDWGRGAAGPMFFMRKEAPGYDPEGGDWRYGMTRPDLSTLADGKDGRATECRACHLQSRSRDYVPAVDR